MRAGYPYWGSRRVLGGFAGTQGFEPRTHGFGGHCSDQLSYIPLVPCTPGWLPGVPDTTLNRAGRKHISQTWSRAARVRISPPVGSRA
jgi:hypothetical protein